MQRIFVRPGDQVTRLIDTLTIYRHRHVDLRKHQINRIRGYLKLYFPQVFELLGGFDSRLASAFLKNLRTLEKLVRAQTDAVRQFYIDHNCRCGMVIEQRLERISDALPLTTDAAVVEGSSFMVQAITEQLQQLNKSIEQIEHPIAELMRQHPDGGLFQALPGAGAAMAPRLLAAFGDDRTRFNSAAEVQQYCGVAPVTRRSGQSHSVHRRLACSRFLRFLRQTFHEFARLSIGHSTWARAYYELQLARGKSFHVAVRSLAFKWIRILYQCWKTRTPYDELKYLNSLRQRNSPLLEYIN